MMHLSIPIKYEEATDECVLNDYTACSLGYG